MAHPSPSFSSSAASPGVDPRVSSSSQGPDPAKSVPGDDLQRAISNLRAEIGQAGCDVDLWLQHVAETAQRTTAANGAAIAMRQETEIVCRARAGEMAPPLGTKLDASSGISGECLRTARPVRCEDTTRDARVDPEVRRQLGLWSLAAVSLGQEPNVIGILEVFSALPYSFSLRHLEMLQQLAELVMATQRMSTAAAVEEEKERNSRLTAIPTPPAAQSEGPTLGLRERVGKFLEKERQTLVHAFQTGGGRRKLAVFGMAALAISLGLGWFFGQAEPAKSSPPGSSQAVTRHVRSSSPNTSAPLVWGPQPAAPVTATTVKPSPSSVVVMAGKRENVKVGGELPATSTGADVAAQNQQPYGDQVHIVVVERRPVGAIPAVPSQSSLENAPTLAAADSGTPDPLGTVLSAPASLPEAGMPVSQGLTGGVLLHHVQPAYPEEARAMRLEGAVVLQAIVAADGRVQRVHVISGHPLLAGAARSAVAHWRYRPFLLNGTPVPMQTEIKVDFKLPTE